MERPAVARVAPRRADARRNIEAIIDAAERCLARDPDASVSDIAADAGFGRVTIYGHFKSRRELVEAVVRRALDSANAALSDVDLRGNAIEALARLIHATWEVTVRSGSLLVAAEKELAPEAIRQAHTGELEERVRALFTRGRKAGDFRKDLPVDWLVATFHAILHAAAHEIKAGRLQADQAPTVITETMLGACRTRPTGDEPTKQRATRRLR